jgi:hypothetical protein
MGTTRRTLRAQQGVRPLALPFRKWSSLRSTLDRQQRAPAAIVRSARSCGAPALALQNWPALTLGSLRASLRCAPRGCGPARAAGPRTLLAAAARDAPLRAESARQAKPAQGAGRMQASALRRLWPSGLARRSTRCAPALPAARRCPRAVYPGRATPQASATCLAQRHARPFFDDEHCLRRGKGGPRNSGCAAKIAAPPPHWKPLHTWRESPFPSRRRLCRSAPPAVKCAAQNAAHCSTALRPCG